MALLSELILVAIALTVTMFATKRAELGFPCAIFWAITGGQAYVLSVNAWVDLEYYLFFASFGMVIFTMLIAFGLREKRDTIADVEMEGGEGNYIDERGKGEESLEVEPGKKERRRSRELRERAERRRTGEKGKRY